MSFPRTVTFDKLKGSRNQFVYNNNKKITEPFESFHHEEMKHQLHIFKCNYGKITNITFAYDTQLRFV